MPEENNTAPVTDTTAAVAAPAATPEEPKVTVKIAPPEAPKKPQPKPVRKMRTSDANDPDSVKAFIARKNNEHTEILENAGYKPVAVSAIINTFTNQEKGYEESHSRDHLVLMLEYFGEHILYRTDRFTIDESAVLDSLLIAAYSDLMAVENLFDMSDEDSMKTVTGLLDSVWKRKDRIIGANKAMFNAIKQFLTGAINPKYAEGYAQRARYLLECILFIRTQQIEIWAGMFHEKPVYNPRFEKRERVAPPTGDPCPICGKPMRYSFAAQKYFCPDSTCDNWLPPPEKKKFPPRGKKPEKVSKAHESGYDSGKPVETKSGAEKFKERYSKGAAKTPKAKQSAATDNPSVVVKRGDGKSFDQAGGEAWGVLDQLKLADGATTTQDTPAQTTSVSTIVPTAEAPVQQESQAAEAPSAEKLPPPLAEVAVE